MVNPKPRRWIARLAAIAIAASGLAAMTLSAAPAEAGVAISVGVPGYYPYPAYYGYAPYPYYYGYPYAYPAGVYFHGPVYGPYRWGYWHGRWGYYRYRR
jgi:hypothetical protein